MSDQSVIVDVMQPSFKDMETMLRLITVGGKPAVESLTGYVARQGVYGTELILAYGAGQGMSSSFDTRRLGSGPIISDKYKGPVFDPANNTVAFFRREVLTKRLSRRELGAELPPEQERLIVIPEIFMSGVIAGILQGKGLVGSDNLNGYMAVEISDEFGKVLPELNSAYDLNKNGVIDLVVARLDHPSTKRPVAIVSFNGVHIGTEDELNGGLANPAFFQPALRLYAAALTQTLEAHAMRVR